MAGLTVGQPTGQQGSTQNPQAIPAQSIGASTQTGSVQPGTSKNLLNGQNGMPIGGSALTTVSLDNTGTGTRTSAEPAHSAPQHHVHAWVFIIPAVFCLVAIGMFWQMTRTAKSTTD